MGPCGLSCREKAGLVSLGAAVVAAWVFGPVVAATGRSAVSWGTTWGLCAATVLAALLMTREDRLTGRPLPVYVQTSRLRRALRKADNAGAWMHDIADLTTRLFSGVIWDGLCFATRTRTRH